MGCINTEDFSRRGTNNTISETKNHAEKFSSTTDIVQGLYKKDHRNHSVVTVGDTSFFVDVAATPDERAQGLSGRESLDPMSGMLFLYPTGTPYSYWTKGMLFSIDILWIGSDCKIVEITPDLPPAPQGTPDIEIVRVNPRVGASHVLELAAGVSNSHGLNTGDEVRFIDITKPGGYVCAPTSDPKLESRK